MDRRAFIKSVGFGAAMATLAGCATLENFGMAGKKPNVIVIFTDDQGWADVGCYGAEKIKTPNIDRMAKEGVRFTDFYVGSSVCSPSRTALLTGRYPVRAGVPRVLFPSDKWGLPDEEVTIANVLKDAGYATMCIGKWHLGHHPNMLPTKRGFDQYFGIPYSNDMNMQDKLPFADDINRRAVQGVENLPLMVDDKVVEIPADQSTLTKRYTDKAIEFIEQNKETPFFLYLPHTMPHIPLYVSKEFEGTSQAGLYGDTIEEIDFSVGRILDAVKQSGLDKNTLIVFTTDNGPWLGLSEKGRRFGGSAMPLRSGKFESYEGGFRVPCVMRWPGKIKPGRVCGEVASTIDFMPTFANICGASVPTDRVIDGKDISKLMFKNNAKSPHHAFYYYHGNTDWIEAVRQGRWKFLERNGGELYDLENDISESNNLADKHPQIVSNLREMMRDFDKDLKADARPLRANWNKIGQ